MEVKEVKGEVNEVNEVKGEVKEEVNEVNEVNEVKGGVKPASWLGVKHCVLDDSLGCCQSSIFQNVSSFSAP